MVRTRTAGDACRRVCVWALSCLVVRARAVGACLISVAFGAYVPVTLAFVASDWFSDVLADRYFLTVYEDLLGKEEVSVLGGVTGDFN